MRRAVLDEADLLLSFGHEDDIGAIAAKLPRGCQCMLVSATARCAPPAAPASRPRSRYPARLRVPRRFKERAQPPRGVARRRAARDS